MSNSCIDNSTSPFCTCQDYYGFILPEYKIFDGFSQRYNCCFNANTFFIPNDTSGDSWIKKYASKTIDTSCISLLGEYDTDVEFKSNLPILYYQTYMVASLFSKFTTTASFSVDGGNNKVSCTSSQIPYIVSYPNYHDDKVNYKVLCSSQNLESMKNIKFIGTDDEIDYKINYLKTIDGKNCTSSECDVKYDPINIQYNFGDQAYKSKATIMSSDPVYSLWFWLVGLIFIVATAFVIYFLYRRGMEKYFHEGVDYLNSIDMGLGDKAKYHSFKVKNSFNHINS